MPAGERLDLRDDSDALVSIELLELLNHLAEPLQLPLEPRAITDLALVLSSPGRNRRIPHCRVAGIDDSVEDLIDGFVDNLCSSDQSHCPRPRVTVAQNGRDRDD